MRRLSLTLVLVLAALTGVACSAAAIKTPGSAGSAGASGVDPFGNSGTAAGAGGAASGADINGGAGTPGVILMKQPDVMVTSSLIWIANSQEGTVSKIDTRTMTELGRYKTSPRGLGLPSRTSVSGDGDVAVANRNNATTYMGGEGGAVTKIAGSKARCVDKNKNGMIDTSTGKTDVKNFGEDECVIWHTPINHFSNRPVAWAPPAAPDAPPKVWTSGASNCGGFGCSIEVFRLNGATGAIEDMLTVSGLAGPDALSSAPLGKINPVLTLAGGLGIANYGAYGGASDAGGNLWLFVINTTQIVRIDATTLAHREWPTPMGNGYGITIDEKGRVFVCGAHGVSRFDPSTQQWDNNFTVDTGLNGCMTDGHGKIWVGSGSDSGANGLFGIDAESLAVVDQVNTDPMGRPMKVKGVSVDVDMNVWGVGSPGFDMMGSGNIAWRYNPATKAIATYEGLTGAYSYSDMTGFGLASAGVKQVVPQ